MKKLALAATIDNAYGFFFRNIISIIGVFWFPVLIFVAVVAALVAAFVPHPWLMGPINVETFIATRLPVLLTTMPIIAFVGLLVSAMVRVGVLEHALGRRTKTTLFYFSLGAPVWRMVLANILTAIALFFLVATEVALGVALHYAVAAQGLSLGWLILFDIVQVIALVVLLIYISVRLFFFLPAVIVAENRIGFGRSWSFGGGNVARIIVIVLAVVLPVSIVVGTIGNFMIMPMMFSQMPVFGDHPTAKQAEDLIRSLLPAMPYLVGVNMLGGLISSGVLLGAVGKGYAALNADPQV